MTMGITCQRAQIKPTVIITAAGCMDGLPNTGLSALHMSYFPPYSFSIVEMSKVRSQGIVGTPDTQQSTA